MSYYGLNTLNGISPLLLIALYMTLPCQGLSGNPIRDIPITITFFATPAALQSVIDWLYKPSTTQQQKAQILRALPAALCMYTLMEMGGSFTLEEKLCLIPMLAAVSGLWPSIYKPAQKDNDILESTIQTQEKCRLTPWLIFLGVATTLTSYVFQYDDPNNKTNSAIIGALASLFYSAI